MLLVRFFDLAGLWLSSLDLELVGFLCFFNWFFAVLWLLMKLLPVYFLELAAVPLWFHINMILFANIDMHIYLLGNLGSSESLLNQ